MSSNETKYAKTHEWVRIEGDVARVGLSDYAQEHLGDVVSFDLPAPGTRVEAEQSIGAVDSVKAASDIYSPITGEVIEINTEVESAPEIVNQDAEGAGWLLTIKPEKPEELEGLMGKAEYNDYIRTL